MPYDPNKLEEAKKRRGRVFQQDVREPRDPSVTDPYYQQRYQETRGLSFPQATMQTGGALWRNLGARLRGDTGAQERSMMDLQALGVTQPGASLAGNLALHPGILAGGAVRGLGYLAGGYGGYGRAAAVEGLAGLTEAATDPNQTLLNYGLNTFLPMATPAGAGVRRGMRSDIGQVGTSVSPQGDLARQMGFQPTVAQLTGNEADIRKEVKMAADQRSAEQFRGRYDFQDQTAQAQSRAALNDISPELPGVEGRVKGAVDARYKDMDAARDRVANPKYRASYGSPVDVTPTLGKIEDLLQVAPEGSDLRRSLENIRKQLTRQEEVEVRPGEFEVQRVPVDSTETAHLARQAIDDLLDNPNTPGRIRHHIGSIRNSLDTDLKQNPIFREADSQYAQHSTPINILDMSTIASLRRLDPQDARVQTQVRRIFGGSTSDIVYARDIIRRQDPEAWDALVRLHLSERINKAVNTTASQKDIAGADVPGQLASALWKNESEMESIRAALSPMQFGRLNALHEALVQLSRTRYRGSQTDLLRQAGEEISHYESGGVIGRTGQAVGLANVLDWPERLGNWIAGRNKDERFQHLVDIALSGDLQRYSGLGRQALPDPTWRIPVTSEVIHGIVRGAFTEQGENPMLEETEEE